MNAILQLFIVSQFAKALDIFRSIHMPIRTLFKRNMYAVDNDAPKYCVKCNFFMENGRLTNNGKCAMHPKITNETQPIAKEYHYCATARVMEDMCGKSGKHFIPATKEE